MWEFNMRKTKIYSAAEIKDTAATIRPMSDSLEIKTTAD